MSKIAHIMKSFRLSSDIIARLEIIAFNEDKSQSQVLAELVKIYYDKKHPAYKASI
jgi:predicted transcriptional regulator